MNEKIVKILGIGITIVGAGISILSEVINEKKIDNKLDSKIAEALKRMKES